MALEDWVKRKGKGTFTWGAKYICFRRGEYDYEPVLQVPEGKEDTAEWCEFAELMTDQLNSLIS
jgi:hypothetical protein